MAKDYKELYEERAAIRQFDGGLSQQEAEEKALVDITQEWIQDNDLPMNKPETYNAISKFRRDLKR